MIRRALLAAVLWAVAVPQASAQIWLLVDPDLTAYLHNPTASDISFDGYQIAAESDVLDVAGWDSISDRFPARLIELLDTLGAGSVAFGELNPSAWQVAEGNLTGVGVLKSGAKFSLGKPFGEGGYYVSFFFKVSGFPEPGPLQPPIYVPRIPEPSTLVLAALGGLGLVATRSRCLRSGARRPQLNKTACR